MLNDVILFLLRQYETVKLVMMNQLFAVEDERTCVQNSRCRVH